MSDSKQTLVKVNHAESNTQTYVNLNNVSRLKPSKINPNLTFVEFDNTDHNFVMIAQLDHTAEMISDVISHDDGKSYDWAEFTLNRDEYDKIVCQNYDKDTKIKEEHKRIQERCRASIKRRP